jgi:N-(2-amino-2-carboxyethyl)-L-glutamate synthase
MIKDGILCTVGNTPLVRLTRIFKDQPFHLFAKLESFNPGGSMKDRPAMNIISQAIESGAIQSDTVVVESSSGNMGIGLAQACAFYGLRFICVVDPKVTRQNARLMEIYGAEVDFVREPDPGTGEFLQARLNRVKELVSTLENCFWPNQYANLDNPRAHHRTMAEIVAALDGRVDYLFCATSTVGTLRGCAEYAREKSPKTKIIAVDAVGSVIFGGPKAKRLIPGHGAAVRPELFQPDLAERCVYVTDLDCVVGCRRLVREEAILSGGSSGGVISAFNQVKASIPAGSNCVVLLADRGERYLDTIYSDAWVREHLGDVEHLWVEHLWKYDEALAYA